MHAGNDEYRIPALSICVGDDAIDRMDTFPAPSYRGYRFPCEIIAHCNWLYFRFDVSFRDIQDTMLERGVEVSHEAIRLWCLKFGTEYARRLRRRRGRPGDTWHLDEVFCKINGQLVYLWRALAERRGTRCSGAEAPRCEGREAVLS